MNMDTGKALAAGGIWVRDIPTTRPLFPHPHACYNVIEGRNRNRERTDMKRYIEIAVYTEIERDAETETEI